MTGRACQLSRCEKPEACPTTCSQFVFDVFEPATLPVIAAPQLLVINKEDSKSSCNLQASSNSKSSLCEIAIQDLQNTGESAPNTDESLHFEHLVNVESVDINSRTVVKGRMR